VRVAVCSVGLCGGVTSIGNQMESLLFSFQGLSTIYDAGYSRFVEHYRRAVEVNDLSP
jgi:hypothetical protein